MFILLPLFAIILKLVYVRKKKYYYEHLIFSFHFHAAIFLSLLISFLLNWMLDFYDSFSSIINTLTTFYIIWYIYRSLRTFYNSTRWVTAVKILSLTIVYFFLLLISFLSVALLVFLV